MSMGLTVFAEVLTQAGPFQMNRKMPISFVVNILPLVLILIGSFDVV
jgi:hypothetical protein